MRTITLLSFLAISMVLNAQTDNTLLCDSTVSYNSSGVRTKKDVYTYDAKGNLTSDIHYTWSNEGWVASSKDENTYDVNGNKTCKAHYYWSGDAWVPTSKEEWTFDANGNLISDVDYSWSNGEWAESYM